MIPRTAGWQAATGRLVLRSVVAALVAAAMVTTANLPSRKADPPSSARAQQWRAVAVQALTSYEAAPAPVSFQAFVYSQALLATATLYGWDDLRVAPLIANLFSVRNPDGGWGISATRDEFGDGSVNPANTTYTVTLAGHVFPALLAAYQAGKLPNGNDPEPIRKIVSLLLSTSRIATSSGICIAYSRAAADGGAGHCIHNASAGAAYSLQVAAGAGFGGFGLQSLVLNVTRRETAGYSSAMGGWIYQDGRTVVQDPDHNAYNARSMYSLAYAVGREPVYLGLFNPAVNDDGRRAHLGLVSTPGGPGSQAVDGSPTTLWCVMGDRWLAESAAYVTSIAGDPMRLSQAAAMAAADSDSC